MIRAPVEHIAGKWHGAAPVAKESVITLQEPRAGWQVKVGMGPLIKGVEYHLTGVSDDNKTSTVDVSFNVDALAKVQPGRILFQQGDSAREASNIEAMRAQACH